MDSNALNHFILPSEKNKLSGNFKAKCQHCSSEISGSLKATSNFITHLRRKHRDVLLDTGRAKDKSKTDQKPVSDYMKGTSKYSSSDQRQTLITDALISFIAGHKISNIVTDNAANMLKAFNFPLPGFEETDIDENEEENLKAVNEHCDETDNCEIDTDTFDQFPKHCSCFAHSLQLVVKDGLGECGNHLKQLISKASSIVSYVRKSVLASEYLQDEKRLQAANSTRWNSQLYMLQSVLAVPEEKLNSIDCSQKLTSYERKLLKELCQILKPFEEATMEVQKEKSVSGSLAVPLCISLKTQMKTMASTYNTKMVTTLKSSLDKLFSKYDENEDYILATILDPRFKLTWCESAYDKDRHICLLKMKCSTVVLPTAESESPPEKVSKPTTGIFSFLPGTPKKQRHASGSVCEIDNYLLEDTLQIAADPLHYWESNSKKYPILTELALTFLLYCN